MRGGASGGGGGDGGLEEAAAAAAQAWEEQEEAGEVLEVATAGAGWLACLKDRSTLLGPEGGLLKAATDIPKGGSVGELGGELSM